MDWIAVVFAVGLTTPPIGSSLNGKWRYENTALMSETSVEFNNGGVKVRAGCSFSSGRFDASSVAGEVRISPGIAFEAPCRLEERQSEANRLFWANFQESVFKTRRIQTDGRTLRLITGEGAVLVLTRTTPLAGATAPPAARP